jgi:hypothetical protein
LDETRDIVVATRIPIESQSSPAIVDATTARDPDRPRDERVFFFSARTPSKNRVETRRVESNRAVERDR